MRTSPDAGSGRVVTSLSLMMSTLRRSDDESSPVGVVLAFCPLPPTSVTSGCSSPGSLL